MSVPRHECSERSCEFESVEHLEAEVETWSQMAVVFGMLPDEESFVGDSKRKLEFARKLAEGLDKTEASN